jgi:hypothetical protein
VIEKAATGAYIRIDMPRIGRVLPPVRELVAVRIQDRIESQRLNGLLPGASAGNEMIYVFKPMRVNWRPAFLNSAPLSADAS